MTQGDATEEFTRVQARSPRCVWLDGGGARDWSRRRSLIGWLEDDDVSISYDAATREVRRHAAGESVVVGDDPFAVLEEELAAGRPTDQWFGYFGYAARPDLPAAPDPDLPDAVWMRPSHIREFHHPAADPADPASHPADPAAHPADHSAEWGFPHLPVVGSPPGSRGETPTGRWETPHSAYGVAFDRVQEHLHAGNSYEVNLTYRLRTSSPLTPAEAYLRLRAINPAPYAGFLQHDVEGARAWLLSSSPERYALVTADRTIETKPIKGTTPRGRTPEEDAAARGRLASDAKYRAENLMIVDLLRNDLAMVCEIGSVEVPVLMDVESYASVHQLVSTVRGRLHEDVSTVGALRALFPAGSMTGAPKLRTMQIIEEVEATPRGAYSGAFGWISGDGRADLGVVIRSLVAAPDPAAAQGGTDYVLGTGGGITVASEVSEEYAETEWKAARLLQAIHP